MASGTTLGPYAYGTERDSQVIRNDQHTIRWDVLLLHPITHRFSTEVHERAGLDEDEGAALVTQFGAVCITVLAEAHFGRGGQMVEHLEPDVVPGMRVFGAGVSQAYDEVFHDGYK